MILLLAVLQTAEEVQSFCVEKGGRFRAIGGIAFQRLTRLLRGAGTALILFSLVLPQQAVCADLSAGKVVWWGRDIWPMWPGATYSKHTNGVVESDGEVLTNVVAIAGHLGLKSDGTVVEFRSGRYGWEGVDTGLSNVVSVSVEGDACWAIKHDGCVAKWGSSEARDADMVAGLSNVTAIAWAGDYSYLALRNDGAVLGWRIENTLLPDGSFPEPVARPVAGRGQVLSNVVALVSGYYPLVLKSDGTVLCLGHAALGWSAVNSTGGEPIAGTPATHSETESRVVVYDDPYARPVLISGQALSNVTAIAGGDGYHVALKRDGTVVAWSGNDDWQIAAPRGLSNVTAIAGSMALRKDGTVLVWGDNHFGEASVPAGLSNVVAIAAGGWHNLAITTGNIPASVFTYPHGRLEEMEREADLIFKGRAISSTAITNTLFPYYANTHATGFNLISLLKGEVKTNSLLLWHMTHGPDAWGGGSMPSWHQFETGQCYLIFAARLDKPQYLYTVPPDATNRPIEFRQIYRDGVTRTLDGRSVSGLGVKATHWLELSLLLNDTDATNQLYAVDTLDHMSFAGRPNDEYFHSDDFKRRNVLKALLPLVTNSNERVASRAIGCFPVESNAATVLEPFAATLIGVAAAGPSPALRLNAIGALSGAHFESVSNSLVQLLHDPSAGVRSKAVALLARFPGDFAVRALRQCAEDDSPRVRAGVADVIGNGRLQDLLPTLVKLFADPVGRQQPVAPLTLEELEGGAKIVGTEGGVTMVDDPNYPGANVGDVHTSAGYALLRFDLSQVGDILRTNLNDTGFCLQFLLKLAADNPGPWIDDMVQIMDARRARNVKKAEANHAPPGTFMSLSGAHWQCWRTIYGWLQNLPATEFADAKMDRYLQVLEEAGNTGSQEPVMLYELYRMKGLNRRALQFRAENGKYSGYSLAESFNRVDAKYATNEVNASRQ